MRSSRRALFENRFRQLNGYFVEDSLERALEFFAEPLTIYLDDHLVSAPDRAYFEHMTREFGLHLRASGASGIDGTITAFHESATGFRAMVEGKAKFGDIWHKTMSVEYFCRMKGDDFLIEMLVVRDLADNAIKHLNATKLATIAQGVSHD